MVYNNDIPQSQLAEMQAEIEDEAFNTFSLLLGRQAKALGKELGHADFRLGHE